MRPKTFSQIYCERNGVPADEYVSRVFSRALYPHARPFAFLLQLLDGEHFSADYDFVMDVGRTFRVRDFKPAAREFMHHPLNRGALRKILCLRVSVRRLRRLMVRELLNDPDAPRTPMPGASSAAGTSPNLATHTS